MVTEQRAKKRAPMILSEVAARHPGYVNVAYRFSDQLCQTVHQTEPESCLFEHRGLEERSIVFNQEDDIENNGYGETTRWGDMSPVWHSADIPQALFEVHVN